MLLLLPLFFKGLLCHGESAEAPQVLGPHHPAAEEPPSFRVLQTVSFANSSWTHTDGSGWLGELQTHVWDSVSHTFLFLRPWSRGNFSKEELKSIQAVLQLYFHDFPRVVQSFSRQFQFEYPFEAQVSAGCLIHPGKPLEAFLYAAYQGSDFLSFQGNSWKPSPGAGSRAQNVCRVLSRYRVIKEVVQSLLDDICPRFLAGLLKAGKSDLERQVKPEAWVSSGPAPGPGRLLLVCHISGFHPKPVWAMWMRGGYSILLTVACLTVICLAVIVTLVILVIADLSSKKQSSNQNVLSARVSHPAFPTRTDTQDPKSSGHQLSLAWEPWIKNRLLKKLKASLKQLW
ncbi:T-cell surface glycoprotein CD1e, membrane-associated isoform X2 [Camelus dromedarius]|uniref:T-cell surface glycoprotein CD1e, membrane-associated isoform X2 n=1 Tax=Camelus bactrianus TaxID=9837 RepID=A0A9W3G6X3_CAMBA|nr:T-cell surface glycoprotein CD1e, membrane-associated isoform X2 [Camelus bactrianus]